MTVARRPHLVAVLALPGVLALDYGIPVQAFGGWRAGQYAVTVCSAAPGPVPVEGGPALLIEHGLDALAQADTIVVPGLADPAAPPAPVLAALAAAAARGARLVSICTGAFVLAAAGLLDGRRATTHWSYAARLAREYPAVTVEPRALYIDEGRAPCSSATSECRRARTATRSKPDFLADRRFCPPVPGHPDASAVTATEEGSWRPT
jgi:transcriptional regulator GlxA family with amidase domain